MDCLNGRAPLTKSDAGGPVYPSVVLSPNDSDMLPTCPSTLAGRLLTRNLTLAGGGDVRASRCTKSVDSRGRRWDVHLLNRTAGVTVNPVVESHLIFASIGFLYCWRRRPCWLTLACLICGARRSGGVEYQMFISHHCHKGFKRQLTAPHESHRGARSW